MDKYWCHYFICWVSTAFVMFGALPAEPAVGGLVSLSHFLSYCSPKAGISLPFDE